jgi:sialic acid synthase SpsE
MNDPMLKIGNRIISNTTPTYFVADIAANHDGDLKRAKRLIHIAAKAGADAAKFQNFRASEIVSDQGFKSLGRHFSHQDKWKKSVFEVYEDVSIPLNWIKILKKECDLAGITYFSTPYDLEIVDELDPYVSVFKIGSGDITWKEMLQKVASKGKPVMLATGASDIKEVKRAVTELRKKNHQIVLMQCNTNYSGDIENFRYVNLNVLKTYQKMYPTLICGLSDHTAGHSAVLGAVALGARIIEKHFTDDNNRDGPDHAFSMTPVSWKEMVDRTRELELALGESQKRIQENEKETVVIQRRCIRAGKNLSKGTILKRDSLVVLRPAPENAISPYDIKKIIGLKLRENLYEGEFIRWSMLESPSGKS